MQFSKRKQHNRWLVVLIMASLLLSAVVLAGCGNALVVAEGANPAKVEHLEKGPEVSRITLTEDAAKRLDIQTAQVQDAKAAAGAKQLTIPYAAVLYDTTGKTWVYTTSAAMVFVRSPVTVDHIDGNQAVLTAGPAAGTAVVTTGAEELFGSETEFEEE
jgi:hypothetical protein